MVEAKDEREERLALLAVLGTSGTVRSDLAPICFIDNERLGKPLGSSSLCLLTLFPGNDELDSLPEYGDSAPES